MTAVADAPARLRALTDLGSTCLVEAAAGTGKTSLLAARLTLLLADGVAPSAIAAITFTELAAGELAARIAEYITSLLGGKTPLVLEPIYSVGLPSHARANLQAAAAKLDELTATTIHGFCHIILRDHAVAVGFDPGVEVMDAEAADAAFKTVFETWLRARFDEPEGGEDPVTVMSSRDPRGVVDMLRGLAELRRGCRSARPPSVDLGRRPDIDFVDAVDVFRRWSATVPAEDRTLEAVADLETLAGFYAGALDTVPSFGELWRLVHPPRVGIMKRDSFDLRAPSRRGQWRRLGGSIDGVRLADEAERHFARAEACYAAMLGQVTRVLVAAVSSDVDTMLAAWDEYKRAAAVVDFDDLIGCARLIVRDNEEVREAVAARFRHLLVDEFQDTDPAQVEVLFRIAAERHAERWQDAQQRAGALFLVGDPKQAIYAFRGADAASYDIAKQVILLQRPGALIELFSNFRSRPALCAHVDRCFAGPLSAPLQPGYVPLASTRPIGDEEVPCVAQLDLKLPPKADAAAIREAEAAAVADLCARLVGALMIDDGAGSMRRLRAADIALLTPAGTDLWRYERALTRRGLPVASQAGKRFYARQEIQDMICLARVLANVDDTLAFGALMRGPLVGLTDEHLLDITEVLRERHGEDARFTVATEPDDIDDEGVREVLVNLHLLRRRAAVTTPFQILSDATAAFHVRAILCARSREAAPGALANLDAFLEIARGYSVRGLVRFVQDLDRDWRAQVNRAEGRADADDSCIEIVTIHAAKGLEWPVTIPINAISRLHSRRPFFHRASDDTLHWTIGDVVPPDLAPAIADIEAAQTRECRRVGYVAATRARELSIIPRIFSASDRTWAGVVDLDFDRLPEFDPDWLSEAVLASDPVALNNQDPTIFAAEDAAVAAAVPARRWLKPSDHDPERLSQVEVWDPGCVRGSDAGGPVGAGRLRGLVIHKLIEELLTGESPFETDQLSKRAAELLEQIDVVGTLDARPSAIEMSRTAIAALALPDIAAMRPSLMSEVAIHAIVDDGTEARPVDGRADALYVDNDGLRIVVDWKTDVNPSAREIAFHDDQMLTYLSATGAGRGALVYVSFGLVRWVQAR